VTVQARATLNQLQVMTRQVRRFPTVMHIQTVKILAIVTRLQLVVQTPAVIPLREASQRQIARTILKATQAVRVIPHRRVNMVQKVLQLQAVLRVPIASMVQIVIPQAIAIQHLTARTTQKVHQLRRATLDHKVKIQATVPRLQQVVRTLRTTRIATVLPLPTASQRRRATQIQTMIQRQQARPNLIATQHRTTIPLPTASRRRLLTQLQQVIQRVKAIQHQHRMRVLTVLLHQLRRVRQFRIQSVIQMHTASLIRLRHLIQHQHQMPTRIAIPQARVNLNQILI
jgi:hypothetical protein